MPCLIWEGLRTLEIIEGSETLWEGTGLWEVKHLIGERPVQVFMSEQFFQPNIILVFKCCLGKSHEEMSRSTPKSRRKKYCFKNHVKKNRPLKSYYSHTLKKTIL